MWFLVIALCIVIPFVCIEHLMPRVERFFETSEFEENSSGRYMALVIGKNELADETVRLLKVQNIRVLLEAEPFMPGQNQEFHYIFALSDNDVDNILMCRIGKKTYNINNIIGLCNDIRNERIYKSEGIPFFYNKDITAKAIIQTILQEKEARR